MTITEINIKNRLRIDETNLYEIPYKYQESCYDNLEVSIPSEYSDIKPTLHNQNSLSLIESADILQQEFNSEDFKTILKNAADLKVISEDDMNITADDIKKNPVLGKKSKFETTLEKNKSLNFSDKVDALLEKSKQADKTDKQDFLLNAADLIAKLLYISAKNNKKINKELHRSLAEHQTLANKEASQHIKSYLGTIFAVTGAVLSTVGGFAQIVKVANVKSSMNFLRVPARFMNDNDENLVKGVVSTLNGFGQVSSVAGKTFETNQQTHQTCSNTEAQKQQAQRERLSPHEDNEESSKCQQVRDKIEEKRREAIRAIYNMN